MSTAIESPLQVPVEMTADAAFSGRIVRLMRVSALVLGYLVVLALWTGDAGRAVVEGLLGGWILMPLLLGLSLRWPRLRYALVVPSSLVSLSLLAISLGTRPEDALARAGWLLVTGGVLLGGVLGAWFWFRLLPVPAWLQAPFSTGRWCFIWLHVALIVSGLVLVTLAAW